MAVHELPSTVILDAIVGRIGGARAAELMTVVTDALEAAGWRMVHRDTLADYAAKALALPDVLTALSHLVHWHDQLTPADIARAEDALRRAGAGDAR